MTKTPGVMIRNLVAMLTGQLGGALAIGLVQSVSVSMYPPAPGADLQDPAQLAQFVASMPLGAFAMLELSYICGSFIGGFVTASIATERHIAYATVVGLAFTVAGCVNLFTIPHPIWVALMTTLTYVPLCYLGARLALKVSGKPKTAAEDEATVAIAE